MKIHAPIRRSYSEQRPVYEALEARVNDLFQRPCRDRRWHYEARVKGELSFALKVETGRVPDLNALEDFFGCTIVVRNSGEIAAAVAFVTEHCTIIRRRPPSEAKTNSRPTTFEFDDLRLYAQIKKDTALPPRPEDGRLFEVQVKTFLFHAWSIATHDLIYKSDDVNWGKERIAFQVRAMLEQAEVTIEQASQLAQAATLKKSDRTTDEIVQTIKAINDSWPAESLPDDLRRLSVNILDLLKMLHVAQDRWKALLAAERTKGPLPLDENPYQTSVRLLIDNEGQAVRDFLAVPGQRNKIVLYEGQRIPDWIDVTSGNVLWVA